MNTIQKFDTIHQYNELLGQETLHPLVNVIDLAVYGTVSILSAFTRYF